MLFILTINVFNHQCDQTKNSLWTGNILYYDAYFSFENTDLQNNYDDQIVKTILSD